jgi:hypothetical protein
MNKKEKIMILFEVQEIFDEEILFDDEIQAIHILLEE